MGFPPTINTGWLPYKTAEFPDGYPVVIDLGAFRKLSDSVKEVKILLDGKSQEKIPRQDNPHEILYGELKQSFSLVPSDQAKASEFWNKCIEKKEQGYLIPSWKQKDFRGLRDASALYAQRLNPSDKTDLCKTAKASSGSRLSFQPAFNL